MSRIQKVLVANRGEIAVRIISSAKKLGVKTIAVYSDADKNAMHVKLADERYYIGNSPASESYLRMDKLIEIARRANANAIIPGYGFLSESASFAALCEANNLKFVGPPSSAIQAMGSKSMSKKIMEKAGVPIIRGYHGEEQDPVVLQAKAAEIGYPVLLKAVLGGGGKGMRIVHHEADFFAHLESAKREAFKSFKDDVMLVEKYVESPRHIEVQVFGDSLGNYVYLFERDCSIQRRHQKIVEEAPAPHLAPEIRKQIGEAAVRAAKAVHYEGAGTVEFIFDTKAQQFYFMEMNTRLQVEHPITEMITGQDLVQWQLQVAAGLPLPRTQAELDKPKGHALEVRIYAENPDNNFLPETGTIEYLESPATNFDSYESLQRQHAAAAPQPLVRIDTGVSTGSEIGVYYDPMVSKVITWAPTREIAIEKLNQALSEYRLIGIQNNIDFVRRILRTPAFMSGRDIETGFIAQHSQVLFEKENKYIPTKDVVALAIGFVAHSKSMTDKHNQCVRYPYRVNARHVEIVSFTHAEVVYNVSVEHASEDKFVINFISHLDGRNGRDLAGSAANTHISRLDLEVDGVSLHTEKLENGSLKHVLGMFANKDYQHREIFVNAGSSAICLLDAESRSVHADFSGAYTNFGAVGGDEQALGQFLKSPMTGKIEKIFVKPGQQVKTGDAVIVIEAMKMENTLVAPRDGVIKSILCELGKVYNHHATLVEFEA